MSTSRLIALCVCLCASTAYANERPTSERVIDGIGFGLSAGLGTAAGAGVGGFIGALTCDDTDGLLCLGPVILGVLAGAAGGFLGGGLLYHGLSDGDGSLWGAAGGAAAGVLAAAGLFALVEDDSAQISGGLGLVVLGAGLGYALFDDASVRPEAMVLPDSEGGVYSAVGISGRF